MESSRSDAVRTIVAIVTISDTLVISLGSRDRDCNGKTLTSEEENVYLEPEHEKEQARELWGQRKGLVGKRVCFTQ